jgi:hypothetical protein
VFCLFVGFLCFVCLFCFAFVMLCFLLFYGPFLCFCALFCFCFCLGRGILHHFDVQNFILMRVYFREILQQINFSDSVG